MLQKQTDAGVPAYQIPYSYEATRVLVPTSAPAIPVGKLLPFEKLKSENELYASGNDDGYSSSRL